jgi:tetratricopeptide (TPR) repeat protein
MARRPEQAEAHYQEAMAAFRSADLAHAAARVSAALGEVEWAHGGLIDQAVERMEEALVVLRQEEHDADLATLAAELGRLHYFKGEIELAAERIDLALEIAEGLGLPEVISQALNTKGIVATARARPEEGIALLSHALTVALANDRSTAALRAYYNLAELSYGRDRYAYAIELHGLALDLAGRIGSALWEQLIREAMPYPLFMAGRWDEALERAGDVSTWDWTGEMSGSLAVLPTICVNRGLEEGLVKMAELSSQYEGSTDVQRAGGRAIVMAVIDASSGKHDEAFAHAEEAIRFGLQTGADSPIVRIAFASAVDSAFALGDLGKVEEVLGGLSGLRRGEVWPSLLALGERANARLAAARADAEGAEPRFKRAIALFREIGMSYWLAATLTEFGEWLAKSGRSDEARPMLEEARGIFERLDARPWLERLGSGAPAPDGRLAPAS